MKDLLGRIENRKDVSGILIVQNNDFAVVLKNGLGEEKAHRYLKVGFHSHSICEPITIDARFFERFIQHYQHWQ